MSDIPDIGPTQETCPYHGIWYPSGGSCPRCQSSAPPVPIEAPQPAPEPVPIPTQRDPALLARIETYNADRKALQARIDAFYAEKDGFYDALTEDLRFRGAIDEERRKTDAVAREDRERAERLSAARVRLMENQSRREDGSVTGLFMSASVRDWQAKVTDWLDDTDELASILKGTPDPCLATQATPDEIADTLRRIASESVNLLPEGAKNLEHYLDGSGEPRTLAASLFNSGGFAPQIAAHLYDVHRRAIIYGKDDGPSRGVVGRLRDESLHADETVHLYYQTTVTPAEDTDLWFAVGTFTLRSDVDVTVKQAESGADKFVLSFDNWVVKAAGSYDANTHDYVYIRGAKASLGCATSSSVQRLERAQKAKRFEWESEAWVPSDPSFTDEERISLSPRTIMIDGHVVDVRGYYVDAAEVTVYVRGARVSTAVSNERGYWQADFECPEGYDCAVGTLTCKQTIYDADGPGSGFGYRCAKRDWSTRGTSRVAPVQIVVKTEDCSKLD